MEGFVDDDPSESNCLIVDLLESRMLGPAARILEMVPIDAVIGIGSPNSRAGVAERLADGGISWPVLIHPDATIGPHVRLDAGSVVAAGARLSTNIDCGRHVQIDQNVTVGHDTKIGDFVRLNPQACVCGAVTIGTGTLIGANATILQGVNVGDGVVVGAGSCVVRDVAHGMTVRGVPAK